MEAMRTLPGIRFLAQAFVWAQLLSMASVTVFGQAPLGTAPPGTLPAMDSAGRMTFRVAFPKAAEVVLSGQWSKDPTPMSRDAEGTWSVTLDSVPPGVHEYSFVVDGVRMIDPGNPAIKPMREPRTSILHLPANPPSVYDFQDVPHGTVRYHTYFSKPLDRVRELCVYVPAGYERGARKRYPTLYLQHGSGDNHATWTVHGKAHWIMDNLIAQRLVVPMVIVMMDGHAAAPGRTPGARGANTQAFERDLLEVVLPMIEGEYTVRPKAAQRAIIGLSMGGGQALTVGLNHTDTFGWVGGFSASPPAGESVSGALERADQTNQHLKWLWIGCGKDDFLLARNEEFISRLNEAGIDHEWVLTEGDHSWPVWRGYLADVLPRLFR